MCPHTHTIRYPHLSGCFTAAFSAAFSAALLIHLDNPSYPAALLLLYCCFTHTPRPPQLSGAARTAVGVFCFTAALLLLYCCFTHTSRPPQLSGAARTAAGVFAGAREWAVVQGGPLESHKPNL